MVTFATTFTKFRFYATALLVLPLLVSTAAAAPATDTHPLTKRPPASAAKPKPSVATASAKQTVIPALASPPVASVLPTAVEAPQTVQLKGIVLAPDGRPCAGASVYPAGAPRQLVVTDAQGAFSLSVPAGAPVSVRVDYFGEGSSRVEVPAPGAESVRITLGK